MSKQETINKYREEFLKGRSEAFIAKFNEKDEPRQYQSIMTWRYNRRKGQKGSDAARSAATAAETPLQLVERLKHAIMKLQDTAELDEVGEQVKNLQALVADKRRRMMLQEIDNLENSRQEISRRLEMLRQQLDREEEPSLFDVLD